MPSSVPTFDELISHCTRTAVHLEMRDTYAVDYEEGPFAKWRSRFRHNPADRADRSTPCAVTPRAARYASARPVPQPSSSTVRQSPTSWRPGPWPVDWVQHKDGSASSLKADSA